MKDAVKPLDSYVVYLGRKGCYYKKHLGKDVTDSKLTDFVSDLQKKRRLIELHKILGFYPSIVVLLFVWYKLFEVTGTVETYQDFVVIKNKTVNLRERTTDKNSKILEKARKGDKFILLEEVEDNWLKVLTSKNDTAFIPRDLAGVSAEIVKSKNVRRFDDNPNMRYALFGLTVIALLLLRLSLYIIDKKRALISITYDFDEVALGFHKSMISAFEDFTKSSEIWGEWQERRLESEGSVWQIWRRFLKETYLEEIRRNPEETKLKEIGLKEIGEIASHELPYSFLKTNVKIPFIRLQDVELYFLPDCLLLKKDDKFSFVQYSDLRVEKSDVENVTKGYRTPKDAKVKSYTYMHVTKSGEPDKRYKFNPKINTCIYTAYSFLLDGKIGKIKIIPSKYGVMNEFVTQVANIGKLQRKK